MSSDYDPGQSAPRGVEQITDPGEYRQRRLIGRILDLQDNVIETKRRAMDAIFEGETDDYWAMLAIRQAVEDYIRHSRSRILNSAWPQWYWAGHPPTTDGRQPVIVVEEENEEGEIEAVARPVSEVDLSQVPADSDHNLLLDDNGRPPFGIQRLYLGGIGHEKLDDPIHVFGLKGFMDLGDPIIIETTSKERHPIKYLDKTREQDSIQPPIELSLRAFDVLNEFWETQGIALEMKNGLPVHRGFDTTRGDGVAGELDQGENPGAPPL